VLQARLRRQSLNPEAQGGLQLCQRRADAEGEQDETADGAQAPNQKGAAADAVPEPAMMERAGSPAPSR
jgi:hypothetical protein